MKKTLNIVIVVVLILAIIILLVPFCFPVQLSNVVIANYDANKQYESSSVITISATDSDVMDDIVIKSTYNVDNLMSETYKTTELISGSACFKWEQFFKYETLRNINPFTKHTIMYNDSMSSSTSVRPGESVLMYKLIEAAQSSDLTVVSPHICFDTFAGDDVWSQFRLNYTYTGNDAAAQAYFDKVTELVLLSSETSEFFSLSASEEQKLGLSGETSKLYLLLKDIFKNTTINVATVIVGTYTDRCGNLEIKFDGTYIGSGESIPLTIRINQNLAYTQIPSVEALFKGLNQIEASELTAD